MSVADRRRVDRLTVARLLAAGIDPRPPLETSLRVVGTSREYVVADTIERWLFAQCGHARACQAALTWDAFQQGADLTGLRHVRLRPSGRKAQMGELASEVKRFSDDLSQEIGRLVTKRVLSPLLIVIQLRFDPKLICWDIHAHCLWIMKDQDHDTVWNILGTKFSTPKQEKGAIREPGAMVNYMLSGTVEHREVPQWPIEAVIELWKLPRTRLHRFAGEFAAFRRANRDRVFRRDGDVIIIENRPTAAPAMARKGAKAAPNEERVVAYVKARVDGQEALCAVVKRPRPAQAAAGPHDRSGAPGPRSPSLAGETGSRGDTLLAGLGVTDTDNRVNSPRDLRAWGSEGVSWQGGDGTRHHMCLPWRHRWWVEVWPSRGDRLAFPVRRMVMRFLLGLEVRGQPAKGTDHRRPTRPMPTFVSATSAVVEPRRRKDRERAWEPRRRKVRQAEMAMSARASARVGMRPRNLRRTGPVRCDAAAKP